MGRVTDIYERLTDVPVHEDNHDLTQEAAVEIERLRSEVLRLHAYILRSELAEIHARESRG